MIAKRLLLTMALVMAAVAVRGQGTSQPVGLWRSVDDHTGESRATIRIFEHDGVLFGRIEKIFDPKKAAALCERCGDDRSGRPLQGLDIIRGLRPDSRGGWSGGEILDPETGKTYRLTVRLDDGGRKLVLRGSIMGGLIGRSQTWLRAEP